MGSNTAQKPNPTLVPATEELQVTLEADRTGAELPGGYCWQCPRRKCKPRGSVVLLLPSGWMPPGFSTVTSSPADLRSQRFPGSRRLPQGPPGGDEQPGDLVMEHLASVQRLVAVSLRYLDRTEETKGH